MRHTLRAFAFGFALPVALAAQGGAASGTARAPSGGFDAKRLARIDSMLNKLVADEAIPGAVAMLVRDGHVVYHKAFGYRDIEKKAPLRRDDIFRIASQTKAITSLAAMMLWEEGRFSLDEPISKYLPEFKDQTVLTKFNAADSSYESKPAKRRTTIRQLFTHTSGLDYADIGSDEFKAIYAKAGLSALGRDGEILADKIRILGKLPLKFEPGDHFNYSLSIDVLGRLVEVLSGMPLDRFFRTRIFEPLRMNDTWFSLPADRISRLVPLHREVEGKLEVMKASESGMHPDFPARPVTYFSGGGGLSSTTADYARFLQLFLNGGELDGVRLISRKTVELMLTDQLPGLIPAFGLGFALETSRNDYRSVVSEGTFSWGGAFATTYWADPKERLVGLLYMNVFGLSTSLEDRFKNLVYSAMR